MKTINPAFNLYRSGLRAILEMMKYSLVEAKRLHGRQLKTITDSLTAHEEMAKRISAASTIEDLLTLQNELARAQIKEALLYWGGTGETADWSQWSVLTQTGDAVREIMGPSPASMEPLMSLWKSMADNFCDACTLTSRATADAARLATDQVELATTLGPMESAHNAKRGGSKAA